MDLNILKMSKRQSAAKLINNTYGVLTILSEPFKQGIHYFYKCKCTCGKETTVRSEKLILGPKSPKSCIHCRGNNISPTIAAPRNVLKSHYQSGALKRNLEFSLSDEEFNDLIYGKCYYCGQEPTINKSDNRYNKTSELFIRNGIDRIDSNKGYFKDNCVSCCTMCNRMKLNYTIEDFFIKIQQIYDCLLKRSTTIPEGSTLQVNGSGNGELLTLKKEEDDIVYSA